MQLQKKTLCLPVFYSTEEFSLLTEQFSPVFLSTNFESVTDLDLI